MGATSPTDRAEDGGRLATEDITAEELGVPSPRNQDRHERPACSPDGAKARAGYHGEDVELTLRSHSVRGDDHSGR